MNPYIFIRGFRRTYNQRGLDPRGLLTGKKKLFKTSYGKDNQNTFVFSVFFLASKCHNKSISFQLYIKIK